MIYIGCHLSVSDGYEAMGKRYGYDFEGILCAFVSGGGWTFL